MDVVLHIAVVLPLKDTMSLAACNTALWEYAKKEVAWRQTDRVEVTLGGTTACRSMSRYLSGGRFAQPDTLAIRISGNALRSAWFPVVLKRLWSHTKINALELVDLRGSVPTPTSKTNYPVMHAPVSTVTRLSLSGANLNSSIMPILPNLLFLSITSPHPSDLHIGTHLKMMSRLQIIHLENVERFGHRLPRSVMELKCCAPPETMMMLSLPLVQHPHLERVHLERVQWFGPPGEFEHALMERQLRGLTMLESDLLTCLGGGTVRFERLNTSALTRLTSLHVFEDGQDPLIGLDHLPTTLRELSLDTYEPHMHWLGPPDVEHDGEPSSLDLSPLTALTHLGLRHTALDGHVHQLSSLTNLKSLDLTGSSVDVDWAWVPRLTRLRLRDATVASVPQAAASQTTGSQTAGSQTAANIRNALPCLKYCDF